MTTITKQTNSDTYGADILHYAGLKGEQDSGPLFFALAHHDTLIELSKRIDHAVSNGDKVRPVVLEHWHATPEGEKVQKEYAQLIGIKARTAEQEMRAKALLEMFNQINTQTQRNVDTVKGVDLLRAAGFEVNIQRIQGTSKYACYVVSLALNDDGTRKEFIFVPFTATQLRKLATMPLASWQTLNTADVRKACDSLKQGTPNATKGNNEAIDRTQIAKVAKALDTAITASGFIDGKIAGMSAAARGEVMLLWAMIDCEASQEEKATALKAYRALAAKPEPVKPAEVVKPVKKAAKKAA